MHSQKQFSFVYSYRLRIESMLLKAEFDSNVGYLAPSIEAMVQSGEELMSSQKLQDLFYMVLMAGNFLNSVSSIYINFALSKVHF